MPLKKAAKGRDFVTIADLHELAPEAEIDCEVCIIGSGPAGATIARELAQSRVRVVLLESGGAKRQPQVDALNEIENFGWSRELNQWLLRNRIIGGSSHTWAGRCAPFDSIDFEEREWIPFSGWPFGLDELRLTCCERSAMSAWELVLTIQTTLSGHLQINHCLSRL